MAIMKMNEGKILALEMKYLCRVKEITLKMSERRSTLVPVVGKCECEVLLYTICFEGVAVFRASS